MLPQAREEEGGDLPVGVQLPPLGDADLMHLSQTQTGIDFHGKVPRFWW